MISAMTMTRKEFLDSFAGMAKAAAAIAGIAAIASCGGDDGPADAANTGNCATNGTIDSIASNHGHVLMVSAADVTAGVQKMYDISGTAGHSHMVTVSAAMFTMLQGNHAVTTLSTTGGTPGHNHSVTITCA
jgi:hypothetical protein